MEQRIDALEEELKVLKNQVKAVLLDIKEYLATGNGQTFAPAAEISSPVPQGSPVGPQQPMGSGGNQTVIDLRQGARPEAMQGPPISEGQHQYAGPAQEPNSRPHECAFEVHLGHGGPDRVSDQQPKSQERDARYDGGDSEAARTAGTSALAIAGQGGAPIVDLLTVSVVAQWMSRAIEAVGKDQIDKLVEIYDITSSLPPGLKETMLLLSELYGGDGDSDISSDERRQVPATVSVQLLIELDSLLRYRQGALESVVFSMLVDKGLGAGNNGHG